MAIRAKRLQLWFTVQSENSLEGAGFFFVSLAYSVGFRIWTGEGLSVLARSLIIAAVLRESAVYHRLSVANFCHDAVRLERISSRVMSA